MPSGIRTVKVCFVAVLAVTALAIVSSQAEAANYVWVELVSVIETNKEILATIEPGTKFNIRGEILGASMVIECGEVALKHGVIFNDSSSTLVGQDSGELELKVCLTSFCPSVSATIKIPILG